MERELSLKSTVGFLTLLNIGKVGPVMARRLAENINTIGELLDSSPDKIKTLSNDGIRKKIETEDCVEIAFNKAKMFVERNNYLGVKITNIYDEDYPKMLSLLKEKPLIIYSYGNFNLLNNAVGVIGTKKPDNFGLKLVERVTDFLCENDFNIISGCDVGIEEKVYNVSNIDKNRPSVVVMPCGFEGVIDGSYLEKRVQKCIDNGGLVISEYELNSVTDSTSLIRKNRMITGLSLSTFILQFHAELSDMYGIKYCLTQPKKMYIPVIPEKFIENNENSGNVLMLNNELNKICDFLNIKYELRKDIFENNEEYKILNFFKGREDYSAILESLNEIKEKNIINMQNKF